MKILLIILTLSFGGVAMASDIANDKADDYEGPAYNILVQEGDIEIRQYAPMITASVSVQGSREGAANKAFSKLADFIFGNNTVPEGTGNRDIAMTEPVIQEISQKIDMTAPVVQENISGSNEWIMRFVMPSKFTMDTLPKPNNDEISIEQTEPKTVAAIQFSWFATQDRLDDHQDQLLQWLDNNDYQILSEPYYAFYNSPFTLPFNRRHEVMVNVKAKE